jgi:hypothetical protein
MRKGKGAAASSGPHAFDALLYSLLNPDVAEHYGPDEMRRHMLDAPYSENRFATWNESEYRQILHLLGHRIEGAAIDHFASVGRIMGLPADCGAWVERNRGLLEYLGPLDARSVREANRRLRGIGDDAVIWLCVNQDPYWPLPPSPSQPEAAEFYDKLATCSFLARSPNWVADILWLAAYCGSQSAFLELARLGAVRWGFACLRLVDERNLLERLSTKDILSLAECTMNNDLTSAGSDGFSRFASLAEGRPDFGFTRVLAIPKLKQRWDMTIDEARTLLAGGERAGTRLLISEAAQDFTRGVEALIGAPEVRRTRSGRRALLIVTSTSLPQCLKYRVKAKVGLGPRIGIEVRSCTPADVVEGRISVSAFNALLFYRCEASVEVFEVLALARRHGCWTVYETDDALLTEGYPGPVEQYEGALSGSLASSMALDSIGMSVVAQACDFGLGSTDAIAESLAGIVSSGRAFTIRNVMDDTTLERLRAQTGLPSRRPQRLAFATASASAGRDFLEAAAGVETWVGSGAGRRVVAIAPWEVLHCSTSGLWSRMERVSRRLPFGDYMVKLEESRAGIVPLAATTLNQAKSVIRWMEFSAAGLVTIASQVGGYSQLGEEGLIFPVQSTNEWGEAIAHVMGDNSLSDSLLTRSRDAILTSFTTSQLAQQLVSMFDEIEDRTR